MNVEKVTSLDRMTFETVCDKPRLTIVRGVHQENAQGPLLVIFGSILPKTARPEFAGIVARSGRSVLWVMEHQFDYYANPATVPVIVQTIRDEMALQQSNVIDTLGFFAAGCRPCGD